MNRLQIGRYAPSDWYGYSLIKEHYGLRTAKRSKVPLINHIHEGLLILDAEDASAVAADAFCLHPLVQDDTTLDDTLKRYTSFLGNRSDRQIDALLIAMEYRGIANGYLSSHCQVELDYALTSGGVRPLSIKLGPLSAVHKMLRADKIQNRKDFEQYHKATHPNSDMLQVYFQNWFSVLGISEDQYQSYCEMIDRWHEASTNEITNHDV